MRLRPVVILSCNFMVTVAGCMTLAGSGDAPHPIPRTESAVEVDGILNEPAWEAAWTIELPYEVYPADNTSAPVRTEVFVMHDDANLYVGLRAHDPEPKKIRAHLSDRDDGWDDDWMGVILDTELGGDRGAKQLLLEQREKVVTVEFRPAAVDIDTADDLASLAQGDSSEQT